MPLPPLVEPGRDLTPEEVRRYARHLLLPEVGRVGQRRLGAARVLLVGAGGLGSPALLYLAAAGVGTIGVVDPDVVDETNLQRQVIHGQADVGRLKVDSAADAVAAVNPLVQVVRHPVRLDATQALDLVGGYDLVLDGADNFATRYLVDDTCALLGIPHVWGSVLRFQGQASVWWRGHGPCYRCVFPTPPPAGSVPSCAEAGVLGILCAVVASVQVTEAIKLVVGAGEPVVGRLLLHDALAQRWDTLRVERNPDCPLCGDHPTITAPSEGQELCGLPTQEDAMQPDQPDAPTVTATELAAMLRDRPGTFRLVDVRGEDERAIVSIPGAEAIHLDEFLSGRAASAFEPDEEVVIHCRSGVRSATALRALTATGHTRVRHLEGGVLAWAHDVDPSLPTY
ncbi:molybdopterin-synthase adenylyltransferase MoeB [Arsenicicoccus dermatophilus]|uniref:molybdopterin-synthase adenylyltransferase MoeB n=1 Tax=Arsenicicoccus dermatophilus TaxID=1076331 RepID=UPI001F4CB45D|nr:molybdopterin-synthase adenylyltransferase MoeB [Arsenicicoccus dermatophilus]MCH8613646.1 molybdopterin-synthase adenylyltransferase MoeB [Arsenicicoccus dermatophilus]